MILSMAQMSMSDDINENLNKTVSFCDKAKGSDLLFFPEIQLSPFFPQYENTSADKYLMNIDGREISELKKSAKKNNLFVSPNIYLSENGKPYDASIFIDNNGNIIGTSKMVHIAQAKNFYEQDYYTPSDDGFKVFDTPFGKVGIVICYDRHLPESIRTVTLMGADLIIIPTANTKAENLEMFEWEIRVQAMQNQVYIAMCNRVGKEDNMTFAGQSLAVAPDGTLLLKADDKEGLITIELDLSEARKLRSRVPYIETRRPEMYR